MTFLDEKPADIQSLLCMAIAVYAVKIIVPRTAKGYGIVQKIFYT